MLALSHPIPPCNGQLILRFSAGHLTRCRISELGHSRRGAPHVSELLSAKRFEFCAAGHAEIAKQVHRPAIDHLPQFEEGLVGRQICIDDISFDLSGAFEDLWRGKDAHPAQLCVELDQRGNVRLSVLERMDIAF